MKKKSVLTLLLAVLCTWPAFFSCSQKEWEALPEGDSFEYRFALAESDPDALPQDRYEPDTRAVLEDRGVFWEAGDRVALFTGNGPAAPAAVDVTTKPKTIVFSSSTPLPEGTAVYACYPYIAGTELTAAKISFPAVQQGGSSSAMPMAAVPFRIGAGESGTQGVVHFLNLGALIDFRVYSAQYAGETIRSVTLTAASGTHPVSGQASIDLTGVDPGSPQSLALAWPSGAPVASSVTLKQGGTVAATLDAAIAAGHRYMVLSPGTYSGSLTVATNIATYTFPFANLEFKRNALKRFNLNLESSSATREAYYYRVNAAGEVHDGDTFLIAFESSATQAQVFHPVLNGNSFRGDVVSAAIADRGILSAAATDACQVTLEAVSGSPANYYIKVPGAGGSYLSLSNNTISTSKTAAAFTFDGNGGLTIKCENSSGFWTITYYLQYNNSAFRSASSASTLALYRKDDGSPRSQNLRFSASSLDFVIDGRPLPIGPVTGPQLSGAMTAVRYTSGNTSVATVDENSGALTIRGAGQTRITATAGADEMYGVGTASYKLTVWEEATYSIENDAVAAYLDYIESHPYDPADYSYSYVKQFSSGTSSSNRLDMPKPVPVTWTQPSSGTVTVVIYNDAAHTREERMANVTVTSSTSAEVYSLIPGRKYWYVVKSAGSQIAEGHFSTTGRRRMIKVADCPFGNVYANNCRDFGGLETIGGKVVKYDKIYRGTCMDKVTDAQRTYLMQIMNVGLDVDLREYPESPSSDGSNMYNGLGLDEIANGDASIYRGHTQERYNSIEKLTDPARMGPTLTRIMNAVENGVGVYVHCKVGADRTGFTCLLLEALLGVKQEQCDIDYELTSFCAAVDDILRERGNKRQSYYYYPRGIEILDGQPGATLQEKAVNYVTGTLGVPMERITAFQECMLENPSN